MNLTLKIARKIKINLNHFISDDLSHLIIEFFYILNSFCSQGPLLNVQTVRYRETLERNLFCHISLYLPIDDYY